MSSLTLLLLAVLSLLSFSFVSAQSSGYCFSYTFTGGGSAATQWTVTAAGVLTTSSTLSSAIRNTATITAITGTRTFSNASFTSTVSFTGVNSGTNSSNLVSSAYPYADTTGWSLTTSGPVYYQNAVGSSVLVLSQSFDPLLESSGSQTIYVGELKVTVLATVSSVSQCPANVTLPVFSLQPYSFCWYIQSDGTDAVSAAGYAWTTYAYGVFTASQTFEQEGRQAMQLNSITGLRYFSINGSTWWNRLVGVRDDISDLSQWGIKNDNIVYTTTPYLDQYGWLATADANLTYPAGTSQSPDINFEYDQFATLQYIDLNADNVNYVQSSNQGFAYAPYQANGGGAHAVCNKLNNTAQAFTPQTTQWTFCYVIYGADTINGAWQITSSGTITTYAQAVNVTSVDAGSTVVRQGYVAIGITGTRVWSNSSTTISRNILGLVPSTELFEANVTFNNVVYTSFPYVDKSGLTFYLDGPVLPYTLDEYGAQLNNVTFVSIASSGYNPLTEQPTGGEEGSLIIRAAASNANLPAQCASMAAGTTTQYSFCYSIAGDKSANDPAPTATWTISAWGIFTVTGPFEREGHANTYRVTAATGQRLLTITTSSGVTTNVTQNILNIRAPNADTVAYGFLTNNILYVDGLTTVGTIVGSASMKTDQYGLLYTLDSNPVFPTNTGTTQAAGPDVNFGTDQFGTFQYYEESTATEALIAQSANSALNLNPYTSGAVTFTCPNTPASYTPGASTGPSGGSGYCFSYTFTGGSSAATQWTVTASGVLSTNNQLSSALRNQATITDVTGTRTFTNASFTSTVSFTGVNSGSSSSNAVFSAYPYADTTGWSLTTSGPVYYQNAVGSSVLVLSQSFDPLLESSGSQTIYVGELKVTVLATVSSVSQCPANVTLPVFSLQPYSFCWYIQSDGTDAVSAAGYAWTTYAYGVFTASQTFEQEGRQAMQLNSITGLRYFSINGSTWWNRLVGVRDDISDLSQWGIKNDNIVYTTTPYLDQYGWLATADANLTYPAGTSQSPDINFEYDQFATLQYIDLNADNVNYVQSSNQGFAYAPYQANGGGAHAVCNKLNNTAQAFTPQTTQWTFCYVIYGADTINGAWQITSSGTITTYAQAVNVTSVDAGSTVVRQGYVAIGITGTRVWSNSSTTISRNILGLVPSTELFEANVTFNNVVYTSFPYVDKSGLTFYLDGPVLPYTLDEYGAQLNNVTFVSIASSGYNPLTEQPTGGEEGSLIIRAAASNANLPAQCASMAAGTTTQYSFCYSIAGDKSANDPAPTATWTISAWGIFTVTGPFEREGHANTYRVTAATGQRLLTITTSSGVTTNVTQNILNIRAPNADTVAYGFLTNNILYVDGLTTVGTIVGSASMKTDQYGLLYTLDSNPVFPTNTGTTQAAGPDVNFGTDQFGTFQYYEESTATEALIAQSANSALNLNPYTSGAVTFTCPNTPASYTPGASTGPSGGSGYCFSYTFTGGSSAATQWTVTASGVLSTNNQLSSALRNQATITDVTGTRTFTNASFTSTVSFTGVNSGSSSSNAVFSAYPYADTTGWSLTTSGPVYYQNAVGSSVLVLSQSFDPLLESSGSQTIYVGELKVTVLATVSSVSQCPANVTLPVFSLQPYSFCWYIQSDGTDAVSAAGYAWTTYAYGVFTASQTFEQEGRQAMQLNSITGLRYFSINGSTWWNRLVGVRDDISDLSQWGIKNDNIVYTTTPYLDQYGWLATADANLTYPAGTSQSPDINFEYDQFATLQYIDLNADNVNYVQSSNQGFAYAPYQANGGGAHAVCNKLNNTAQAFTPQTTQWTFCYVIYGADSINGQWVIQSSGTITTYAQPVNTTNINDSFPAARLGYVIIGISGTRTWSNSSLTSARNILGVVPDTEVFDANYPFDNVIYSSYPYVDAGGLSFYLDGPVFPQLADQYGQVLNNVTFVNIHANGVNPLKELPTGGEAGALIIRPASTNANLPSQCASLVAGTTSQYSFCYYLTGDKSAGNDPAPQATWTVSTWGVVTVSGPFEREGVANTYRVTGIQGQRSLALTTAAGVSSTTTQNIVGIRGSSGDIVTYNFATDNILSLGGFPAIGAIPGSPSIYVDLYGWLITLDGNVVYPANNGTVTSVGPDLDLATDQFGTNQYQDVSVWDATPIFLQSSKSGMNVQPYSSGSVSFTCPNTPASYTPGQQSGSGGGGSGLSGGAIAGIVVGSVVGALLLLLIAAALCIGAGRRSDKSGNKQLGAGSTDTSESSQVQHSRIELQSRDTVETEPSQAGEV